MARRLLSAGGSHKRSLNPNRLVKGRLFFVRRRPFSLGCFSSSCELVFKLSKINKNNEIATIREEFDREKVASFLWMLSFWR